MYGCKEFRENPSLQIFYALYCVYFSISAWQISQGLPTYRKSSATLTYEDTTSVSGDIGNLMCVIFTSLPFAQEIKSALDFTMSKTALDLF